jgi:hypothetical protein
MEDYELVFKPRQKGGYLKIKNPIERIKDYKKEAERLIYGNSDYPSQVRSILKEVGDSKINSAKVFRTPVPKVLIELLNVASLGDFKKKLAQTDYDKLFHSGIIFSTDRGDILVEKNEVINVSKSIPKTEGYEEKSVSLNNQNLTIKEVLDKTQSEQKDRFFKYSAYDNNCQKFILDLLKANNIGSESDKEFVKQDTEQLFRDNQNLRKLANTITDVASRITGRGEPIGRKPVFDRNGNLKGFQDIYNIEEGYRKTGGLIVKENPYNDW